MALDFNSSSGSDTIRYWMVEGSPSDVNLTVTATTAPSDGNHWSLSFNKANETVEVFLGIEWDTAGTNVSAIEFDLPTLFDDPSGAFYPTVIKDNSPYTVTEEIPPYSQFTDAVLVDGAGNETACVAWVRYHNSTIKFKVEAQTGVSAEKVQARFRYHTTTALVSFS